MFSGIKKAVFFGAHTDDEMICAGTLRRLVKGGVEVLVVTFSPAATSKDRIGGHGSDILVRPEWTGSIQAIGGGGSYLGFTPSSRLVEKRQDICQVIFDYCEASKPDMVFSLSPHDSHTVHAMLGQETERVTRGRVPTVLRCHFPWNYGAVHYNLFVKLTEDELAVKRKVIETYESQKFRYRYGEMLLAYAVADGLSVKVPAAEKFEIVQTVV